LIGVRKVNDFTRLPDQWLNVARNAGNIETLSKNRFRTKTDLTDFQLIIAAQKASLPGTIA